MEAYRKSMDTFREHLNPVTNPSVIITARQVRDKGAFILEVRWKKEDVEMAKKNIGLIDFLTCC